MCKKKDEGNNTECPVQSISLPALTEKDIIFAQNEDKDCKSILELIQENNTSEFLLNDSGMIYR